MKYSEYLQRTHFSQEEILAIAHGNLVDDPPAHMGKLPTPPMLMFDRVLNVERAGNRGRMTAELDVRLDAWYFQCHFKGDPVQPGCLGVDAVWQLMGLYLSICDCPGTGRALGCREVEFSGQIRPHDKVVRYELDVRRLTRLPQNGSALAVADATVAVDGDVIYAVTGARVGTFLDIDYRDYPRRSERSRGGIMRREKETT
ncbi:MAG: bifunctional 3-hydroxydecanoyl-ACP dehydratase/trans-2-decenoyl-ACP isomerase [Myxococcota bacterium]